MQCSGEKIARLEEALAGWYKAELALTTGQNYSIEGASVSRVDPDFVSKRIDQLERALLNCSPSTAGTRPGVSTPKWT